MMISRVKLAKKRLTKQVHVRIRKNKISDEILSFILVCVEFLAGLVNDITS